MTLGFFGDMETVVSIDIYDGFCQSPVSVRLRVVVDRGCRGVWLVIKFGHACHVTNHALFISGIDICVFEVALEGGYCSVQDIVYLFHFVSLGLPVFGFGFSEAFPHCGGNIGV